MPGHMYRWSAVCLLQGSPWGMTISHSNSNWPYPNKWFAVPHQGAGVSDLSFDLTVQKIPLHSPPGGLCWTVVPSRRIHNRRPFSSFNFSPSKKMFPEKDCQIIEDASRNHRPLRGVAADGVCD